MSDLAYNKQLRLAVIQKAMEEMQCPNTTVEIATNSVIYAALFHGKNTTANTLAMAQLVLAREVQRERHCESLLL